MLNREFYVRDANLVSIELLGKLMVHKTESCTVSGVIVETEAYLGPEDAAAHSYKNLRSSRTEVQFQEGGFSYIYFIYGMHHCFNIVANIAGKPEAILVRALEPVDGIDIMKTRRGTQNEINLCNGPGKLCQAMGLDMGYYGADLCGDKLFIEEYRKILSSNICISPRINVDYAGDFKDKPWRYSIKDNKYISRHKNNRLFKLLHDS